MKHDEMEACELIGIAQKMRDGGRHEGKLRFPKWMQDDNLIRIDGKHVPGIGVQEDDIRWFLSQPEVIEAHRLLKEAHAAIMNAPNLVTDRLMWSVVSREVAKSNERYEEIVEGVEDRLKEALECVSDLVAARSAPVGLDDALKRAHRILGE